MSQPDHAELRAKAEAATPGPWEAKRIAGTHSVVHHPAALIQIQIVAAVDTRDTAFIAAANPATVLSLIDELDRLRRLLALAAEHVPDDCDHHNEIREALR